MNPVVARVMELRRAGELAAALDVVREARAAAPLSVELAACHALVLADRGEHAAAIPLLEQCASSIPVGDRARILTALAASYDALDRGDDVIEVARAALALDPERVPAAILLGVWLGKRQRIDEALAVFHRARPHAKPKQQATIDSAIASLEAWNAGCSRSS